MSISNSLVSKIQTQREHDEDERDDQADVDYPKRGPHFEQSEHWSPEKCFSEYHECTSEYVKQQCAKWYAHQEYDSDN